VVLAISKLFLGDTDWNGAPDASGWKHFGFDIDHKISTLNSTDLCKPLAGATAGDVYPDGDDGIDNAYGKLILPITLGFAPDVSQKENALILGGKYTLLLHLQNLGGSADYNPLLARGYQGADLGHAASFDGTDLWPVTSESLLSPPDLTTARASFAESYVTSDTWVSGPPVELVLLLATLGLAQVPLHHAVLAMQLSADHKSATKGVISGVIGTEELIAAVQKAAAQFDPNFCSGSTFDSIANQFRQASDIMKDGSQDPTKTCDGISIGLGFEAELVQLGAVAAPVGPQPDPCLMTP
jgi:hypothetical protein